MTSSAPNQIPGRDDGVGTVEAAWWQSRSVAQREASPPIEHELEPVVGRFPARPAATAIFQSGSRAATTDNKAHKN